MDRVQGILVFSLLSVTFLFFFFFSVKIEPYLDFNSNHSSSLLYIKMSLKHKVLNQRKESTSHPTVVT